MENYYIYHIPDYLHSSGKVGKIGCTADLNNRSSCYGHKYHLIILEIHTDIKVASNREIELQKEFGYPVDRKPYWRVCEVNNDPRSREKKSDSLKGRKHSESHTDKIVKANTGRVHSEGAKKNMSLAHSGIPRPWKYKPILRFSVDGILEKEYQKVDSVVEDGYNPKAVSNCLNNLSATSGKKIWKYKENN